MENKSSLNALGPVSLCRHVSYSPGNVPVCGSAAVRTLGIPKLRIGVVLPVNIFTSSVFVLLLCTFVVVGLCFLMIWWVWDGISWGFSVFSDASEIQTIFSYTYWPCGFPALKMVSLYPLLIFFWRVVFFLMIYKSSLCIWTKCKNLYFVGYVSFCVPVFSLGGISHAEIKNWM